MTTDEIEVIGAGDPYPTKGLPFVTGPMWQHMCPTCGDLGDVYPSEMEATETALGHRCSWAIGHVPTEALERELDRREGQA
jgi:hypothetical protein